MAVPARQPAVSDAQLPARVDSDVRIAHGGLLLVVALAGLKLLLHLLTDHQYGWFRDELYYLACGRRLAWGYVDHPPLIPALAWLIDKTSGATLAALRLAPAVAGGLIVAVTGWMAHRLGGGRFAMGLAALAALVSPAYLVIATILTVNVFDILWWALIQWALLETLLRDRPRGWLLVGLLFGVALLTKYNVAFFGIAVVAGLVLTSARRHLATPWPWLGAGLALLVFAPNLVWQAQHGWPTLEFLHNIRAGKNYPVTAFEFLAMQVIVIHPILAPLWIAGLYRLLVAPSGRPVRLLGVAALTVMLVFMALQAKFYYLFPIYPVLFAAGAVAAERFFDHPRRRWARIATAVAFVVTTIPFLPYTVPILPIRQFLAYDRALSIDRRIKFERGRDPHKPIVYADMFGWPELASGVAKVWHNLPPEAREHAAIMTYNYGEAAAIEFFARDEHLPQPISPHNSYYLWGPGPRDWDTVIAVGFEQEALTPLFDHVTLVTTLHNKMAREVDVPIFACAGRHASIAETWTALKRFH